MPWGGGSPSLSATGQTLLCQGAYIAPVLESSPLCWRVTCGWRPLDPRFSHLFAGLPRHGKPWLPMGCLPGSSSMVGTEEPSNTFLPSSWLGFSCQPLLPVA